MPAVLLVELTLLPRKDVTLADWARLLTRSHEQGIKLMMDPVANHMSGEHAWFKESRGGGKVNNMKREWYIWQLPKYDAQGNRQPPNTWKSIFYVRLHEASGSQLEHLEVREAFWG
ncbi:hypothetical protein HWV62_13255 [Athelia sp. TMB]|nr:hypothetical protein HWV62_13255 [Athelia sp. TMB]